MCDDASDGVCATGSFLLGGFSGGMGGFVGMLLGAPVFGVFGGVTLGVLAGAEHRMIEDHSHKAAHAARKDAEQERARRAHALGGVVTHLRLPHLFSRIRRASVRCSS